ncbi:hypothetical protein HAV15_004467 [Penicillium sp. str. |nr:hypothetical protein HAV15_004467 [Penicillium sp. str. \
MGRLRLFWPRDISHQKANPYLQYRGRSRKLSIPEGFRETSDVESSNRTTTRDDNDGNAENDDNDDHDDARAQHDDFAEGVEIELSAVAGDVQSLRYHLLRGKFYDGGGNSQCN